MAARKSIASLPVMSEPMISQLLEKCCSGRSLTNGRILHTLLMKLPTQSTIALENRLVTMYLKCGALGDASQVFDEMPKRNLVSWNMMINGTMKSGHSTKSQCLFCGLLREGIRPDRISFASVLGACTARRDGIFGSQVHCLVVKTGFTSNSFVGSALVDMHAQLGSLQNAWQVFDKLPDPDLVLWNTMISGYSQGTLLGHALGLLRKMLMGDFRPDEFTFGSILNGCAFAKSLVESRQVHGMIVKLGLEDNVFVGSALVDVYAKCGIARDANEAFTRIPEKNVVLWTAMIVGLSQNDCGEEALRCFVRMLQHGVGPDQLCYASSLSVCTNRAALDEGSQIHAHLMKCGFERFVSLGNVLVGFYSKCGHVDYAKHVFDELGHRDLVSWTAMISGYAWHGRGREAVRMFEEMIHAGTMPDGITFIGVLSACSHSGLVKEGFKYFKMMTNEFCIEPELDHYACMVDLLGRTGQLKEAEKLIRDMPVEPNASIWSSLLASCKIHQDVELGEYAAGVLFRLDPHNASNYVILSNLYASAGMWDDVARVRKDMRERGIRKSPGFSWIEARNNVHAFIAGDRKHPESEEIYKMLDALNEKIKRAGYVPDTNYVLHDVKEEHKDDCLVYHSERIAIAFGLLSLPPGSTIRVIKNLRVCVDCHNAIKFISKVEDRKVIIRDLNRFHHFEDGVCSCWDFW